MSDRPEAARRDERQLRALVGALAPGVLPGWGDPPAGVLLLDLGPDHPSRTGLLELGLWTDDVDDPEATITRADVRIGAMHRGVEKLFEVRDYRQILALADRHDWQAPFAGELTIALAAEELLGVQAPPRAVWLRTLLAEHTRIASHLGFLSYPPYRLGRPLPRLGEVRERLRTQLQRLSGNRIHPMLTRLGGLAADADEDWLDVEVTLVGDAAAVAAEIMIMIDDLGADGVAPLDRHTVGGFGVTGPAARASGHARDERHHDDQLAYRQLIMAGHRFHPTAPTDADARSRLLRLAAEVADSAELITACVERLRTIDGPVSVRLGKIIRLPDGDLDRAIEAPLGRAGCWIVSRGEKTPWRLRLRTPSFSNVQALSAVLPGCAVGDLELALASLGYVVGDLDR